MQLGSCGPPARVRDRKGIEQSLLTADGRWLMGADEILSALPR